MKVAIGCDNAGTPILDVVREVLNARGIEVLDFGVESDDPTLYPDVALAVSEKVASGEAARGVLVCGTGIGMSITANKVPGIRAALVHDTYSAERAQKSNNAQIITMGARVIGPELAKKIVETWLDSEFKDGSSTPKVNRMNEIDAQFRTER
ncbi:MAG: ribose 5-phosphate isomerase B [Chloroflexota bacterium]|nr:ribose 5-phosphate isomerase B [Chloroflexota bacterium]